MKQNNPLSLKAGQKVWMIGIKGTGMCALAEVFIPGGWMSPVLMYPKSFTPIRS